MNWSRRQFLAGGAASIGLMGRNFGEEGRSAGDGDLAIFHTTDLHGHVLPTEAYDGTKNLGGFARCATQIQQWRRESPHHLLLDVGDVYQGTLVSWQTKGRLMIDLFNKLGYDAWTLGNHEFDWGPEVLEDALQRSQMPVLAANVKLDGQLVSAENRDGLFGKLRPWFIKEVAGEKVGIIGLTTPGLPDWLPQDLLGPLTVVDPAPVLRRCIAELKSEGATKLVVAGHMGYRSRGSDFANPLQDALTGSGLDLYLGGHTHQRNESWQIGGVTCTQASYHGLECGRVTLREDKFRPELKTMDASVELDAMVLQASEPFLEKAALEATRVVGTLREPLDSKDKVRSFLGNAFLAAARQTSQEIDAVYHGSFGGTLAKGPFTVADAWAVLPYENRLVVGELSSEELAAIIRESEDDRFSDRELLGLTVLRDSKGLASGVEGQPRRDRYRVLFNSYDAQSGGRRLMVLRDQLRKPSAKTKMLPLETREALLNYVATL